MTLIQFVLIFSSITQIFSESHIKAYMKSLKCESDDSIYNGTLVCRMKPTRDGYGNTTAYYIFRKPANDLWYHMKVFYKFGTIYRQFMIDLDVDVCDVFKKNYKLPLFFQHLLKALNDAFPNLIHPCPYYGEHGYRNADVNKVAGKLIPQVIPKGLYKLVNRWHLKNNRTIITATIEVYVDATDPLKSYEVG